VTEAVGTGREEGRAGEAEGALVIVEEAGEGEGAQAVSA